MDNKYRQLTSLAHLYMGPSLKVVKLILLYLSNMANHIQGTSTGEQQREYSNSRKRACRKLRETCITCAF